MVYKLRMHIKKQVALARFKYYVTVVLGACFVVAWFVLIALSVFVAYHFLVKYW